LAKIGLPMIATLATSQNSPPKKKKKKKKKKKLLHVHVDQGVINSKNIMSESSLGCCLSVSRVSTDMVL
jgi:hypothetical protein